MRLRSKSKMSTPLPAAANTKGYWVIEMESGSEVIFRQRLPGHLKSLEIATILQRLASRRLSPEEVVAASLRKGQRTTLLECEISGPPQGKRLMIWMPAAQDVRASHWQLEELEYMPDIPSRK